MRGADLHTKVFTQLVKKVFDDLEPRSIADLAAIWPPRGLDVDHVPEIGLDVGVDDYEEAGLGPFARDLVRLIHRLPRNDPPDRWASIDEARTELGAIFGDRLKTHVPWDDHESDATLVRLCTHGLAAHMLERGDDGDTWVVDLAFMQRLPVRPGFVPYGALLVLERTAAGALVPREIAWARGRHRPGDAEWELAKLAFRVAVAAAATVRDHAVKCHFLASNAAVLATRTKLPGAHPIRALLRPFQFRTPAINSGALVTLIPERAIFHRLFAFEWDGLARLYEHSKADYRMRSLPDDLARRGTTELGPDVFPWGEDALDLWHTAHRLATEYLAAISFRDDPLGDPALAAFHAELRRALPASADVLPMTSRAELSTLLATMMFVATGYHEQVGGAIGDYLDHAAFVVPTMVDARTLKDAIPSRQTMLQGYMLGVLTNFRMPRITEDFSALVPKAAGPVVRRWITGLGLLKSRIEQRNARRPLPLMTFHPDHLEISVSI